MPTKKRITIPGAIAHIMGRGIDGKRFFSDDQSRRHFLGLFAEGLNRCGCRCKNSQARKEFCYIACRLLPFPVVQVAQFLGCSPSAVH
jgi:hypothetical protein